MATDQKHALDWKTMDAEDCCSCLYQIGGALRRMGLFDQACHVEETANELYPGDTKPLPIVPRTTHG